jgi:hypothetical protein
MYNKIKSKLINLYTEIPPGILKNHVPDAQKINSIRTNDPGRKVPE